MIRFFVTRPPRTCTLHISIYLNCLPKTCCYMPSPSTQRWENMVGRTSIETELDSDPTKSSRCHIALSFSTRFVSISWPGIFVPIATLACSTFGGLRNKWGSRPAIPQIQHAILLPFRQGTSFASLQVLRKSSCFFLVYVYFRCRVFSVDVLLILDQKEKGLELPPRAAFAFIGKGLPRLP